MVELWVRVRNGVRVRVRVRVTVRVRVWVTFRVRVRAFSDKKLRYSVEGR